MAIGAKRVTVIVVLVVAALIGLTAVQVSLVTTAFNTEKDAFAGNVQAALSRVSLGLAAEEAIELAITPVNVTHSDSLDSMFVMADFHMTADRDNSNGSAIVTLGSRQPTFSLGDTSFQFELEAPQRVQVLCVSADTAQPTVVLDTFTTAGRHEVPLDAKLIASRQGYWKFISDSATMIVHSSSGGQQWRAANPVPDSGRHMFVQSVLRQLDMEGMRPIQERLSVEQLDSALDHSFAQAGITLDYEFGVIDPFSDTLPIVSSPEASDAIRASMFSTRLFPQELFTAPNRLAVFFPAHTEYLWGRIALLVVPTAVLMLIIVACFVYTIRTIVAQRRFSNQLVEFINNMTHEFKTPIATVQLAAEAIQRDDVVADPDKVRQFNSMIRSETLRMKGQTDKILQMAVIEEGDLELKREPVDVHALISELAETARLQVADVGGSIQTHLEARHTTVSADRVHLANVVANILDNANKYGADLPTISVFTKDRNDQIVISVSDNGIGISEIDLPRVFEKYYRVSQGNIHNVKGFGLGLSYVKMIVEAMGGSVNLTSRPGNGTTVEISLPVHRRGAGDA